MLQNIRKNLQGTIAKVIVAIIVVPFALFGIESLLFDGGAQNVAEVNGQAISAVELQQQVNQQKRRLLMTLGDSIDPGMLDDQMLAGPALEFIIQKTLMMQAAEDYGLAVSDATVGRMIGEMEVFKQDGEFDNNLFRRVVSDQGYSPAGFQAALREDLILTQLRAGIAGSSFATPAEIAQLGRIREERRDLRYTVLPLEQFRSDADIEEAAVLAWYEERRDEFMTEESVRLAFIELTVEDFHEPVDEADLLELYELEKETYVQEEERGVAHILLTPRDGESDADFTARVAAAQSRAQAADADFSALAAELSDDIGSAGFGGDLGYTSGDVFPVEMEEVIATLAVGEVSGPVETDAGTHLLKLTDIRGGSTRTFDDVRFELEMRVRDERASVELVKKVEALRDLAFNAEDLAGPAAELDITVEQIESITRNQSEGLFANPRLIAAAFSSDVLNDGYNSEVIEVDSEQFVVLRVLEHREPRPLPLEEVREGIVSQLRDDIARTAIRDKAREILLALREGASIEELALENEYEWQVELATTRDNASVPAALLSRSFELPAPDEGQSTFDYVQNRDGDIEVLELVRVIPSKDLDLPTQRRRALEMQIVNEDGQLVDELYQEALATSADITRS